MYTSNRERSRVEAISALGFCIRSDSGESASSHLHVGLVSRGNMDVGRQSKEETTDESFRRKCSSSASSTAFFKVCRRRENKRQVASPPFRFCLIDSRTSLLTFAHKRVVGRFTGQKKKTRSLIITPRHSIGQKGKYA